MNILRLTIAIMLILVSVSLFAQFNVNSEFRSRFITDHGYKLPAKENTAAIFSFDQRSRLIFNFANDKIKTRLSLQDTRVWGSDDLVNKTGVAGNTTAFGVYEAWVDLKLSNNSSLRIGRQEWNYNDMRILSWRNWWTSGLSYDGILYKLHKKESGWFFNLGFSYNNDGTRTGSVDNSNWNYSKLKTMNFLNIKKQFNDKLSVSLMLTLAGKEAADNDVLLAFGTHGIILKYNQGKSAENGLFANASAYYQHGANAARGTDGKRKNISAYLITAELGLRTAEKKLSVAAGMELISGRDYSKTDDDYNNTVHSFDLMYSARWPYYGGWMNPFLVQDSYKIGTKGGGYFDPYLNANYKFSNKTIIDFTFYAPVLTTKVLAHTGFDPESGSPIAETNNSGDPVYWDGSLGNYIDIGLTQKFSKDIILKAGVSYGMASDIKNQMVYGYKNAENKELYELGQNYFVFSMLIVKPELFSTK